MSRIMKNADIDGGRSVMLVGVVHVTDQKNVTFCPDDPVPGVVEPFVRTGKGQLMRRHLRLLATTAVKKAKGNTAEKGGARKTVCHQGRGVSADAEGV